MKLPAGIRQRGSALLIDVTVNSCRETATVPINGAGLEGALAEAVVMQADIRKRLLLATGAVLAEKNGGAWTMKKALEKTKELFWNPAEECVSHKILARNGQIVVDYFGETTPIDSITLEMIDEWVKVMRKDGLSNGTINRKIAAFSKMRSTAVPRGGCNIPLKIKRKKEGQGRIRWLVRREQENCLDVLSQWSKDDHAEVFCLLVDTGLRGSELWRLEARDLDFEGGHHGRISIWRTKNTEPRTIPMTARVSEILHRRAELYPRGKLIMVPDPKNPGKLKLANNDWFGQVWDKMKAHLGLSDDKQFVPYALRHTCASFLVQRGVPLKVVQEWLGHKNITMTMRYAHLAPGNLDDAVKVLEDT